jgi:prepilin-type N-terminal cleavage/methylation domain-containing protein
MRQFQVRGRAFTLIELLVVVAIIALLVGILLPAIGQARKTAQIVKSQANLRSLGQVQAIYAYEHKDSFTNPFPIPGYTRNGFANIGWGSGVKPGNGFVFDLVAPGKWYSEMYGFHWYSFTASWLNPGDYQSEIQFAPLDRTLATRVQDLWITDPGVTIDEFIWDTSYVMTPTAWFNPKRYENTNRPNAFRYDAVRSQARRMKFSDARFPSEKVLLWERFDWSKPTRTAGSYAVSTQFTDVLGTENVSPQWNNPEAEPSVTTVDGSVRRIRVRDIYDRMWTDDERRSLTFRPTDVFDPSQTTMRNYSMHQDGLEYGNAQSGLGIYPALFWATRNGMSGRDFAN